MNPVDADFTKWLVTLGVGGILAGFMFMFYRKDMKQYSELWRITTEQLIIVIKENTSANIRLITLMETLERNSLRKTDIEHLIDRKFIGLERIDPEDRRG